jgi:hypothetical protein
MQQHTHKRVCTAASKLYARLYSASTASSASAKHLLQGKVSLCLSGCRSREFHWLDSCTLAGLKGGGGDKVLQVDAVLLNSTL